MREVCEILWTESAYRLFRPIDPARRLVRDKSRSTTWPSARDGSVGRSQGRCARPRSSATRGRCSLAAR